ncbi:MAG: hypothetical protein IJP78_07825 [Clostridia bacterium]|nr:hypothetical protein [Clostridia bacterium]
MKVRILATGKIEEHNDLYAVRLMEQGKAVKAEEEPAEGKQQKGKKP